MESGFKQSHYWNHSSKAWFCWLSVKIRGLAHCLRTCYGNLIVIKSLINYKLQSVVCLGKVFAIELKWTSYMTSSKNLIRKINFGFSTSYIYRLLNAIYSTLIDPFDFVDKVVWYIWNVNLNSYFVSHCCILILFKWIST